MYDGRDPKYDEEVVSKQSITTLLAMRDVCLVMRHSRSSNQSGNGGYESNELQLEIWFLEKIVRVINKILLVKFSEMGFSNSLSKDLSLDDIWVGHYFDKSNAWDKRYETVKVVKVLFPNFNHAIADDWKFL